ncbi:MAG TPA: hypothetical protein VF209_04775 [Patescibacteria group bacterium]
MNDIRTNAWSTLAYKIPRDWLIELARIERDIVPQVANPRIASLRTNRLKWAREARQAGLLTYGMEQLTGKTINFALYEDSDFDFIARYIEDGVDNYVPVQLKEWVPDTLNPTQSLNDIFEGLRRYSDPSDLTVAIYVSRNTTLNLNDIRLTGTTFKEVWLFGSCSADKSRWFVCGDIQGEPKYFEFDYPA